MYKIVIDSCGELPEELKQDGHYETVSLELEVDGCRIKDDSTFNQLDFLRRVKDSFRALHCYKSRLSRRTMSQHKHGLPHPHMHPYTAPVTGRRTLVLSYSLSLFSKSLTD